MAINDDKESLQDFIRSVYAWLEASHNSSAPLSEDRWKVIVPFSFLSNEAREAWEEFKQSHPLERFYDALRDTTQDRLIQVGLFGKQLIYKLRLLKHKAELALSGGRRAIEKFTEFLEILLDSLLELLGFGDAIKELVGALKAQVR